VTAVRAARPPPAPPPGAPGPATVSAMSAPTQTPTKAPRRDDTEGGTGDAWRVIVLNDNHNTFDGVAFALARVIPGVTLERGLALANRIHNTGSAVVWSGHRERAELYWSQLDGYGLTMAPLER
jgi:ATP-dependent Clp protease adaptor protein ClpS